MRLKENITGSKACYKTVFKYKKNKDSFMFIFKAYNSTFFCPYQKDNEPLYDGDACEVFLTYGKENHYYEIEVSPNGATFLADIENINGERKLSLISDIFVRTKVIKHKNRYDVEIIVPKDKFLTEDIMFNAYRIDTDGEKVNKHLFALNPTLSGTFHEPKSFIKLK